MIKKIKGELKGKNLRICLPEGEDLRILKASEMLKKDGILTPVLLGKKENIEKLAKENKVNLTGIEIIEVSKDYEKYQEMEDLMVELRKDKMTREEVAKNLESSNYFGTMLVKMNLVDALLGGAVYSTANIVRPALQIIKTKPGVKLVSSSFLMLNENKKEHNEFIFADCALNLFPTSEELVEIANQSAETARVFGIDPKVAFLSYSTLGSGKGEAVDKVSAAVKLLDGQKPNYLYSGEFQVDSALVESVAKIKAPGNPVAGIANVLIFPDINAGNIGYKLVERLGGYTALGPILQGLNAPICDLSRGCSVEDVYTMAYITARQAI